MGGHPVTACHVTAHELSQVPQERRVWACTVTVYDVCSMMSCTHGVQVHRFVSSG